MNVKELIASTQVELEATEQRQLKARAEIELILDTARQEGRSNLSEDESERTDILFESIKLAKAQAVGIKDKLARAQAVYAEETEWDAHKDERTPLAPMPTRQVSEQRFHVTSEEHTYSPQSDPKGVMFLRDVGRNFAYQDPQSSYRLARHMNEAKVDGVMSERTAGSPVSSGFGGLVVPQYLVDLTAPMIANMRPFADIANKHALPANGLTFTIPTITTATAVADVSTENTAVQATSIAETDVTVSVRTAAGQQTLSRASLDRGTGIEEIVLQDLFKRYATNLDNDMLNVATKGLATIAHRTDYADASPTGAALYPKILGSASQVEAAMLGLGQPSHVIMHGRRWYWLMSEMTDTWPLINQPPAPVMAGGVANPSSGYGSGPRGVLPCGLNVVVDNNINCVANGASESGATQDEIFVVPQSECHLWEEANAPLYIRAEQAAAAQLGVLLVVYGYFAFTYERYALAMQRINGTGTVAPTGF